MRRVEIPVKVTPLRALDVALWMRHRRHDTGHRCGRPDLTRRCPLMPHFARLRFASIWQLRWQHGCAPDDVDRSLARIDAN